MKKATAKSPARTSVRTTVDIPAALHRKLKLRAAAEGRSARALVLQSIESLLIKPPRSSKQKWLTGPIFGSTDGPLVELTNERMYELIDVP